MTRDDIIRMAREASEAAGSPMPPVWQEKLFMCFAALVAAAERERLAQPEQEPVAWMVLGDGEYGEYTPGKHFDTVGYKEYWERRGYELQPLYTAQPQRQWVEASDKEIRKLIPKADVWKYEVGHDEALKLIRSALALAKEKNT